VQFDSGMTDPVNMVCEVRYVCSRMQDRHSLSFSGKLEALAILLQKLKSEGRRVLILSQMVLMLDILEMFLNFHYLTYVRIDENANSEQRQVRNNPFVVITWYDSESLGLGLIFLRL
jgi:SNF2 family DNA or RNA helicase